MLRFNARDILTLTEAEVWALSPKDMTIVFEDGAIETTGRATIFSWYLWEPLRRFPNTPLRKAHHLGRGKIGNDTHLKILSIITFDCFDAYNQEIDMEELAKLAYEITNNIYNQMSINCDRYVTSLSIFDFLDVIDHPKIREANDNVMPNEASITKTHDVIRKVLLDPEELGNNGIAKIAKSGLVKIEQIISCVGPLGFRTEVDSNIFPNPVLSSFTSGLVKLHDHMIESRSASKALKFAKDPLRTAEYFNRKLQLGCEIVRNVHFGDCGTAKHMTVLLHAANLKTMSGKFYKTERGYSALKPTDKHLVGKNLQMRTIMYCEHPDQYGVCSRCYGEIAYNVPARTNLGHVGATVTGEKGSQHIMSTKHHDGTSNVEDIELSEIDLKYIQSKVGESVIRLSERLKDMKVSMVVLASEANNLTDIAYATNIRALNIHNLTSLTDVRFTVSFPGNSFEELATVGVSMGSRKAALTHDALEYLKRKTWALTPEGNYEIDLTGWDNTLPLFELPLKHMSVVEYVTSIEAKAIGTGGKKQGRLDLRAVYTYSDPEEALFSLYELVTSALDVNIVHLEIILLALMTRDPKNFDFDLPKYASDPIIFGKFREIMSMRSLAPKMAYETQVDAIYSPLSYLVTERPPHILDDMLMG